MNKQLTAVLIITSIFILAMKDSASFVHTVLHYIPNNPWHHHAPIVSKQKINPLEIHTYLQLKHNHSHNHSNQESHEHSHTHAHDIMDHIYIEDTSAKDPSSKQIETSVKIDLFIQTHYAFIVEQKNHQIIRNTSSHYYFSVITALICPPFPPPKV